MSVPDRCGQVWTHYDCVFLVLTTPNNPEASYVKHTVLWLDDQDEEDITGTASTMSEYARASWEGNWIMGRVA
jgi:hypothetical protein